MSTRRTIFEAVQEKHDRRMDSAVRSIMSQDNVLSARTRLEATVRALPGVASDPDTVPDIMRLLDTYNLIVSELSTDS